MGWESYNYLLFAKGNKAIITTDEYGENLLEVVGGFFVGNSFLEVIQIIASIRNVTPFVPLDLYTYQNPQCYYSLNDGNCIIEIEINCGEYSEHIEEISIRFAVSNPIETHEKTIALCKSLSEMLSVDVYDMQLKQTLDFTNEIQTLQSKKCFLEKRRKLIPNDNMSIPLHCGKAFWDWIKDQYKG